MSTEDKIVDKIRKLLALANNNPNEEEAEVALNMALELMEAHNISRAQVEKDTGVTDGTRADEKTKGGLYKWQVAIWEQVATSNLCKYERVKGTERGAKYEHRVVGRPENVIVSRLMAEYLQDAVEMHGRAYAKDRGWNIFAKPAITFREGMAEKICYRLWNKRMERERAARAEAKNTGSTAVALVDAAQAEEDYNNDYLNGWEPGTSAANRARRQAEWQQFLAECEERGALKAAVHEEKMATDPEYRAAFEEAQAEKEKQERKREKRREYNEKRRKGGYRESAEDRKRSSEEYMAGYRKGAEISLDDQIGTTNKGKLA